MIDIYGIGNALVDIEIKITDKECQTLGLDKGHMSLIDETQLNTYLNQFKARIEKKSEWRICRQYYCRRSTTRCKLLLLVSCSQ